MTTSALPRDGDDEGGRGAARARLPREIWVLVGASFTIAMGYGLVAPILPVFARSFDVGVTAASMVVSVFALSRLVFAPAGGVLIGRFGQRRVYLAGLLIVAASSAACALAQTYTQLVVLRSLGGIGSTIFTIASMGLLVTLAPAGARGRASGAFGSAFLLGNVAGPALGTLAVGLGMRVPFVLYALFLLVATAIVAIALPEATVRRAGGERDAATTVAPDAAVPPQATPTPEAAPAPRRGGDLRAALAEPAYRAALLANFAHGWSNLGVRVATVPLMAGAVVAAQGGSEDLQRQFPGLVMTAFALGNIVAVNIAGRASDVRGRRPFLVAGLGLAAVLTGVFGFASSLWAVALLSLLGGVAAGTLTPPLQAVIADVAARPRGGARGTVLALAQMAGDAGSILGPILVGLLVDRAGYAPGFVISGALLALAALPWCVVRAPRRH